MSHTVRSIIGTRGCTRRARAGKVEVYVLGDVQQHLDDVDENRPVVRGQPRLGPRLFRAAHDVDVHGAEAHGVLVFLDLAYRRDVVALDDELNRAAASLRLYGAQHGVVRAAFFEVAKVIHHRGHVHLIDGRVFRVVLHHGDRGAAEAAHVWGEWVL